VDIDFASQNVNIIKDIVEEGCRQLGNEVIGARLLTNVMI